MFIKNVIAIGVTCVVISLCGCVDDPYINRTLESSAGSNESLSIRINRPASYRQPENTKYKATIYCAKHGDLSIAYGMYDAYYTINSDGTVTKCDDSLTVDELKNTYNNIYTADAIDYILEKQRKDSELISNIDNNL